jgi:hypothetical protein
MISFHNRRDTFDGIAYEAIDAIDCPFSKYNPAVIRMNNDYKLTYKIYWYSWSKNRIRLNWLNQIKNI